MLRGEVPWPMLCLRKGRCHGRRLVYFKRAPLPPPTNQAPPPTAPPVQLSCAQLSKLLLCTALYTGAGGVLLGGLGHLREELQPLGGAGLAPQVAAALVRPCSHSLVPPSGAD